MQVVLGRYCVECHGAEKQKGERRFDQLALPIGDGDSAILVQDMIDQLVLGDMPPKKAAAKLAEEDRLALVERMKALVGEYRAGTESTGGEVVLRRLNQRDYRHTVRDLMGTNLDMFDPARGFPREQTAEHFDNVGDVLVTTGYLLDQYLEAADEVVERAFSPEDKPEVREWKFGAPWEQQPELKRAHQKAYGSKYLCVHETTNSENHWGEYAPLLKFKEGVPVPGEYEIEILVEGLNRDHAYPRSRVDIDKDEPMWLGVIPGSIEFGALHNPQPFEKVLAKVAVADGEATWMKVRVWLDEGFAPRFTWLNGPSGARSLHSGIGMKLLKAEGKGNNPFGAHYVKTLEEGKLPHLRIHEVKIRGPLYDEWPPLGRRRVLGGEDFSAERLEAVVRSFAERAYRRPVGEEELERLVGFARGRMESGDDATGALKATMKAVLSAPAFLYLDEGDGEVLGERAFSNRLGYFLWSTMPDDELVRVAEEGGLKDAAVLRGQVERMLADPRAGAFYEGFLDSWFTLRDLGGMPPDRRRFGVYYKKDLKPLMLEETRLFTRHLVEENLSVMNFLDSDFTFVNRTLGQFYGMEGLKGYEFRKVALDDRWRGGLLGQASVLTVTANGIETSPVTRGVWVLENVFGTPPSPPPDDVPALDPDVRGARTVREQLAKHRDVATCNECHRKIDPPGFALENFDAIGRWRERYETKAEIDASSELPSGEVFEDIVGFKEALKSREEVFARTVVTKLLTYGTGRRMEAGDRGEIDRIVGELKVKGYGMREALMLVVESVVMRRR